MAGRGLWVAVVAAGLLIAGCGDRDAAVDAGRTSAPVPAAAPAGVDATPSPSSPPPSQGVGSTVSPIEASESAEAPAEPSETEAPAGGAEPSRPADPIATEAFVETVREQLPDVAAGRSAADLSAVADRACELLADGAAADRVVAGTRSLGTLDAEATDEATARELVKLAIDTVCLEQAPRVDEF